MNKKVKRRRLEDGEIVEIGDTILKDGPYGNSLSKVTRLTKCFAFSKMGEHYEAKFPIVYNFFFTPIPRERYRMTKYRVFRDIKKEA